MSIGPLVPASGPFLFSVKRTRVLAFQAPDDRASLLACALDAYPTLFLHTQRLNDLVRYRCAQMPVRAGKAFGGYHCLRKLHGAHGVVVVICFGFAIGLWAGANQDHGNQGEQDSAADSDHPNLRALEGSPESYEAICQAPKDRVEADLCQQWRSAEQATKMAESADFQVGLSVVGLIGLFATVAFAGHSISTTRRIGQAQVRAYLAIENVTVMVQRGDPRVLVNFEVRNYGQSPARDFTFRMFVRVHRTSLESDAVTPRVYARENDPFHPKYPASAKYRVGAGRAIKVSGTQQGVGLTTEEVAFAKEGSLWVDLSFETIFVDVFDVTVHDTLHFRRSSSIQGDAEHDLSPHSAGTHSHFASQ